MPKNVALSYISAGKYRFRVGRTAPGGKWVRIFGKGFEWQCNPLFFVANFDFEVPDVAEAKPKRKGAA